MGNIAKALAILIVALAITAEAQHRRWLIAPKKQEASTSGSIVPYVTGVYTNTMGDNPDGWTLWTNNVVCSGTNQIMLVSMQTQTYRLNSISYAGVTLTRLCGIQTYNGSGSSNAVWYLDNPAVGTNKLISTHIADINRAYVFVVFITNRTGINSFTSKDHLGSSSYYYYTNSVTYDTTNLVVEYFVDSAALDWTNTSGLFQTGGPCVGFLNKIYCETNAASFGSSSIWTNSSPGDPSSIMISIK